MEKKRKEEKGGVGGCVDIVERIVKVGEGRRIVVKGEKNNILCNSLLYFYILSEFSYNTHRQIPFMGKLTWQKKST